MKGGSDLQRYVDLLVPGAGPTKIRITRGEGPIDLVGSHCVEYFGFKEDEDSDDDEEEGDTDEMETEDQEESAKGNKSGDKKDEKTKKESGDKKASPEKSDKKTTPSKDEKRKKSGESNSGEKKAKN